MVGSRAVAVVVSVTDETFTYTYMAGVEDFEIRQC